LRTSNPWSPWSVQGEVGSIPTPSANLDYDFRGILLENPMKIFVISILSFALAVSAFASVETPAEAPDEVTADSTETEVTMITIYDNYQHNQSLETGWGFSCLVDTDGRKLLFDTGAEGSLLLDNMKKLGIDPQKIDFVVLSHTHGDHTGGLEDFLEANSDVKVYLLKSFPEYFKKKVESTGADIVEVGDSMTISEKVSTTGELGSSIKEQSLLIKTGKGLVVITGCAHPGIVDIVRHAKKITGEEIYLVLGGFHLLNLSETQLKEVTKGFRELGVQKAAPCHCSGDMTREVFRQEYGDDFIENGVGKIIEF
jgi:7,8-dihydropterin-6-yl-methyl-4-(beta-D-ribofuranosyl)aminobenzene 5'-phosphate synthase